MHSLFPDASLSGRRETFVFGKASLILQILILDCILRLTLESGIDLAPEINVALEQQFLRNIWFLVQIVL